MVTFPNYVREQFPCGPTDTKYYIYYRAQLHTSIVLKTLFRRLEAAGLGDRMLPSIETFLPVSPGSRFNYLFFPHSFITRAVFTYLLSPSSTDQQKWQLSADTCQSENDTEVKDPVTSTITAKVTS